MGEGRARGYGRWIAFFILVTAFAGGFGESVVPSQIIVAGNAAATATNIVAQDQLFRLGFVAYLIEAVCDVSLTVFLYLLLRPVRNDVALLGALLRLLGTAVFAVGELIFFSATLILEGPYLRMFTSDQLDALAYLAVQTYGSAAVAFIGIYGLASVLHGYLIYRSAFLPRALGALWMLGGISFIFWNLTYLFAPSAASFAFAVPTALAGLALAVWLIVRGVDVPRWNATQRLAATNS